MKGLIFFSPHWISVLLTLHLKYKQLSGVKSTELKLNVEKKIKPFVFYEKSILEVKNEIQ